ncbi:MAG: response regulator transcription factor [Epsilonproteobacteria bacterium]|nr:response regulator transcription factor [Campylobacterota bacterium]
MLDINILKKLATIYVLIVEDDEMTSYALKQSLIMHCRRVDVANNGMSGFEMFEKNRHDVVIADINLPEMNGLEMVAAMHTIAPHLPVIIITSYDNSENIAESIHQRAYSYLRKPIQIDDLQTTLLMATKDICTHCITLQNNFTYDIEHKLLKQAEKNIVLTKSERELLHLLILNINQIIDYVTIENYVWKEKSMSIQSLRMCVKKIRNKTYPEIIENISGYGYRVLSS